MSTEALEKDALALRSQVSAIRVHNPETFRIAAEFLRDVKTYTKRVHEVFDPIVEAAHKAHKVAVDQRKALLAPAEAAEGVVKGRMAEYEDAQRRAAEEEQRRAEEERLRLEAEARAKAEAEEAQRRRDEEEFILAEAAEAEARGDTLLAEKLVSQPVVVPTVMPEPVFLPPTQVVVPKADGVSFRGQWKGQGTNLMETLRAIVAGRAPATLVKYDEVAVNSYARSTRGSLPVPGIRIYEERVVATRLG